MAMLDNGIGEVVSSSSSHADHAAGGGRRGGNNVGHANDDGSGYDEFLNVIGGDTPRDHPPIVASSPQQRRRMNPTTTSAVGAFDKYVGYYSALSYAMMMPTSSHMTDNTTTAAAGAAAATNNNLLHLLHDGVAPMYTAGRERGYTIDRVDFPHTSSAATNSTGNNDNLVADMAALYINAVVQNVDLLCVALLSSSSSSSGNAAAGATIVTTVNHRGGLASLPPIVHGGNNRNNSGSDLVLGGGNGVPPEGSSSSAGGGVYHVQQVVEIVSAVGIAASIVNSSSIVGRTGIIQAVLHLIDIATTTTGGQNNDGVNNNVLTPFHAEYYRLCLLTKHYRHACNYLTFNPIQCATLDSPYLRYDITSLIRSYYYVGLVYLECEMWEEAMDTLTLCLVIPATTVSPIAIAARKKILLIKCLLLESDELDNSQKNRKKGSGEGGEMNEGGRSMLEDKVLALPGAASAAIVKYISPSSSRVTGGGGGGSAMSERSSRGRDGREGLSLLHAPERTGGEGSSEVGGGGGGREQRFNRRRTRGVNPDRGSMGMISSRGGVPRRVDENWEGGGQHDEEGGNNSRGDSHHLGSYNSLMSAYISGKIDYFAKLMTEMTDLLHMDGNWDFVKRLEGRLLVYRSIRKIASVYSVVGINVLEWSPDIVRAGEVSKRGIEDILMGMTRSDEDTLLVDPFVARLDQSTGMVSFLDIDDDLLVDGDDDGDKRRRRMDANLATRLHSCIALAQRVRDLDIALTTSSKYQQHASRDSMMRGGLSMAKLQGASVADIGDGVHIGGEW